MDDRQFDTLTKGLATIRGRREMLRNMAGALAAAVGLGAGLRVREGDAARICREGGRTCREHANCCSELCLKPDATGRRRCACEAPLTTCGATCCDPDQLCENGSCVTVPPPCLKDGADCDPNNNQCCNPLTCNFTESGSTGFQCGPIP